MGQTERARAEGSLRALAGSMRRFFFSSANASKNSILLRSFFTYYFTKISFNSPPPGFPFGLVAQVIFMYAHTCFVALDILEV